MAGVAFVQGYTHVYICGGVHVHACMDGADVCVYMWGRKRGSQYRNTAAGLGQVTGFCKLLRRSALTGMSSSH